MIVKDWMEEFVTEMLAEPPPGDCKILTKQYVREVLEKHCPFKPGVAYQEVPRTPVAWEFIASG